MRVIRQNWLVEGNPLPLGFGKLLATALVALMPALVYGVETDRITVEDPSSGAVLFRVTSAGNVGIGTSAPAYALDVAGQTRIANSGVAGFIIENTAATFGDVVSVGGVGNPTFLANWKIEGIQDDVSKPSWGINLQVNNDQMVFQRAPAGSNTFTQYMVIKNTGNVGIGTTAPTQKLEVKDGGVRINIPAAVSKPVCDSNVRGTFWLTQKGAGVMDTLEVCIKNASEAYIWKAVW